jgi:tetratricopeptide (TPR) repeat protein
MTVEHPLRSAFRHGDNEAVERAATVQVSQSRQSGDSEGEVEGLYALARIALRDQNLDSAADVARQALAVARRSGDSRLEERPLHVLAAVARLSGDHGRARDLYQASIELNRSLGREINVHTESHNLALTELHLGNVERARQLTAESTERVRRGGYDDFVPYLGIAAAELALADDNPLQATRLIGFTDQEFARLGQVPDPDDASELDVMRGRVAAALGTSAVQAELATGAGWSAADAFGGTWVSQSNDYAKKHD